MKNILKVLLLSFLWIAVESAHADIGNDLKTFFDKSGFSSNVTKAQAYQGQSAGYYTGGSIFARTGVRNTQIAHIDLPDFRAGCGGIDLFTGGLSHIKGDEIVATMKNILNNGEGYAFSLALASVSPLIDSVRKEMQKIANDINALNINSCEAAVGMMGSVWPKTQATQGKICQDIGTFGNTGMFTDYAAARQGCTKAENRSEAFSKGKNSEYKDFIVNNTNIAWQIINRNNFLKTDKQLAEFFMSLSGTIIIGEAGNPNTYRRLESLALNNNLIKALLYGDKTKIYVCDENTACLDPKPQEIEIAADHALVSQVSSMLQNMVNKISTDTGTMSDAEIAFLNATHLPIYKMLSVQAAYYGDALDLNSYADLIAAEILFRYLEENLNVIRATASTAQYPEDLMKKFMDDIQQVSTKIRTEHKAVQHQMSQTLQLIQRTQFLEQMLQNDLSEHVTDTINWAKGDGNYHISSGKALDNKTDLPKDGGGTVNG